jgi:hypothetical protein
MKKLHQIVKLIFKKKLEKRMQQLVARSWTPHNVFNTLKYFQKKSQILK